MLARLGFWMKYQLVMIGAQRYFEVFVQFDFEFLWVDVMELHEGPVVGLVGTIWKHTLIFHLQFHALKLHPVAALNNCCYILNMMKLFNFFFKPIEINELDKWPIAEILELKGQLLDGEIPIILPKDKSARVVKLEHIVAERLKWAISCNSHVATTALCVEVDCAGCITVYEKTFNDAVM